MAETITAAVGTAPAPNRFSDVETVQSLLNQVPPGSGGPSPLLDVDGICGPLTIGAIRKFQQHHFGWQDGRVDVNNVTLAKLNEFDLDPANGNPVKFQEFQPNFGFDPADPVRGRAPWQMVPLGGSKLVRVLNASDVRRVTLNNPTVARALFLGSAVQIFGLARGTTLLKLRDAAGRVLARLDVSVKRKRTVRTSFFFVHDNAGNQTVRTAAEVDAIIAGVNDIWLAQANVEMVKKQVKDPLDFDRDFGTEVRFTAHLPRTGPNAVPISEHEWDIVVARRDRGADYNVFFVNEYEDNVDPGDSPAAGTLASDRSTLMEDNDGRIDDDVCLAHEMGHNLGLPDVTDATLLMFANNSGSAIRKIPRDSVDRVNP
jgi:hypothetical protein